MTSDKLHALGEKVARLLRADSPIPTSEEPLPTPSVDQPIADEAVSEAIVSELAGDGGNAAIIAEQPSSPLGGLDLDTAIHLRWVLRDIKAKRTKLSPVSSADLKRLTELGLIEMHDEEPMLTNEGMKIIAHSIAPESEKGE